MAQLTGNEELVTTKGAGGPVTTGKIASLLGGAGLPLTIEDIDGLEAALQGLAGRLEILEGEGGGGGEGG